MSVAFYIPVILLAVLLSLVCLHLYRAQHAAVRAILQLISGLAKGQYARRTDPLRADHGATGDLARAANALAVELESRSARTRQTEDHLASLLAVLDHTNQIAIATDEADTVRLASPAAARFLDRPVDEMLGRHIDTIIHHPDLRALYKNVSQSQKPLSALVVLQTPGRTLHCQATAAAIRNGPQIHGTLLVLRDVTDVARTLQMKTDFVANASHELRTPLASIRAAMETIRESGPEDAEAIRRCMDIINNHVHRLQLMVQDLLDLSRTEDSRSLVRSDQIDLHNICDMVAGLFTAQAAEKHVLIHIDLSHDARSFRGDERLLTLLLKNLVDNAVKFTHQGQVTIRSYLAPSASAGENASAAAGQFILEVEDTGIGIPPEDRERVFERFYTVNRSRGGADRGTGLGLAIVKHAVNALHGQVTLASEVNKGTTIRCTFPIPAASATL